MIEEPLIKRARMKTLFFFFTTDTKINYRTN